MSTPRFIKYRITRYSGIAFLGILFVAVLNIAYIYGMSELRIRSAPKAVLFRAEIPDDAESIQNGEHLVRTRGCAVCHGENLEGALFFEIPNSIRSVAPNLPKLAKEHTPQNLERAIRQGVGLDGRILRTMPSDVYYHLTDQDVAKIIAYLKSAPVFEAELPKPYLGYKRRRSYAFFDEKLTTEYIKKLTPLTIDPTENPLLAKGEYLAKTTCVQCHGADLRGDLEGAPGGTPDLAMITAYRKEDFNRLMKTGIAVGNRELDLMTYTSKKQFSYFTAEEIDALYIYLSKLADLPSFD